MHVHIEAISEKGSLSLNLENTDLASQAGQQAPGVPPASAFLAVGRQACATVPEFLHEC